MEFDYGLNYIIPLIKLTICFRSFINADTFSDYKAWFCFTIEYQTVIAPQLIYTSIPITGCGTYGSPSNAISSGVNLIERASTASSI